METIKRDQDSKINQHSNSKFYSDKIPCLNSADVKTNGSMTPDHRILPLSKPIDIRSLFDTTNDQDINNKNNPFSRCGRANTIASFVSSLLSDYDSSNSNAASELKDQKNKGVKTISSASEGRRNTGAKTAGSESKGRKNKGSKTVYSENLAGSRGNEDIDTLLEFINSTDKSKKCSVSNKKDHYKKKK